jgi:OCT family organic cation transporter-like MFS transporter 4/5
MDYDARLSSVGELGPWHWLVLVLLIPAALLPGMWSVLFVFSGFVVKHRCSVPACEDPGSQEYSEPWLNFSTPQDSAGWSSCLRYKQRSGTAQGEQTCAPEFFSEESEECTEFVFDTSVFSSTVVSEFSLVCDGAHGQVLVDLGYSMYSLGVFLGVLVPGFFSDRFGRKKMMFLAMTISAGSTLASAYVTDYTAFLVCRVFNGFGTLGTFVTMCILSAELTSQRYRGLVGNLVHILWGPGQVVLALLAYTIRDWRSLHIAVAAPIFVSLLLYPLTPESPRWLIAVGREEEAEKIIQQIGRINRRPAPPRSDCDKGGAECVPEPGMSMRALVSSPGLALTTAILSVNWLVVDFCYYGLSLHSVHLAGDIFTNFALSAVVEVPAVVVGMVGMDMVGRVTMLVTCQLVGGLACILAGLLSHPLVLPLALLGKCASSMVFLTVYLYTAEIYPTQVRGKGLALTATMARIGGFLAPFIAGLGVKNSSLPFLIFGGAAIIGGLAGVLLPETRGSRLPDSLQDVETIMRRRTVLRWIRTRQEFEVSEL